MQTLILIVLFISCGYNAEVVSSSQVVPYVMGRSQIIFKTDGINTEKDVILKCVIRFSDGRDSVAVEPVRPLDGQSVICRLPPEIDSGNVVVDLEATNKGARSARIPHSTNNVLLSEAVLINPSPSATLVVEENWEKNKLSFTWDPVYFQQNFLPGAPIFVTVTMYALESLVPEFTTTVFTQPIGKFNGSALIDVSENIAKISSVRYPYFYVLTPAGASKYQMSSDLFAPTLGMTENNAVTSCGIWLEIAKRPASSEISPCPPCLCQVELDDNFIRSEFDPQLLSLANGAFDNYVLYYERVRTKSGHAQTCSYDKVTRNLATTSPAQASWIHAVSKYESYRRNFFSDIWPYIVCCLQSKSQKLCDLFHENRPVDTGHLYPGAENPYCGFADPHFITSNDVKFDFMGNGEFWLIRGPARSGFGVQGRMSPLSDVQQVSFFNAVAIRDGNTSIQMELKNYKSFHLILNGVEFPIPVRLTNIPLENAHIIINGSLINVRLQTGFSVIVENVDNVYLNVRGSGAHKNKGKGFMGIFGYFSDDIQNELTSRDGFVIPPTPANLLDLSLIHHKFGLTWMTTANESFFVYEYGKRWEYYANPDFGPLSKYPDPATMPEEVRATCGDSLFCYSEYVGTGSLEKATNVVREEQGVEELREEIRSVERPMCDIVRSPANGRVIVNGYFDGSIATYSCDREYDFISGDRSRTCSASENESYWTGEEPACLWTCTACEQNTEYQISQDPSDCTNIFACFMVERFALYCPLNHFFNPATLECEKDYVCQDIPGC